MKNGSYLCFWQARIGDSRSEHTTGVWCGFEQQTTSPHDPHIPSSDMRTYPQQSDDTVCTGSDLIYIAQCPSAMHTHQAGEHQKLASLYYQAFAFLSQNHIPVVTTLLLTFHVYTSKFYVRFHPLSTVIYMITGRNSHTACTRTSLC